MFVEPVDPSKENSALAVKPVQTCEQGHPLQRCQHEDMYECDVCGSDISAGIFSWDCVACDYSLCRVCRYRHEDRGSSSASKDLTLLLCPDGHLLRHCKHKVVYECDVCASDIPASAFLWDCAACNYSLCQLCRCKARPQTLTSDSVQCIQGHLLWQHVQGDVYECEICQSDIPPCSVTWYCIPCDYSLCGSCYESANSAMAVAHDVLQGKSCKSFREEGMLDSTCPSALGAAVSTSSFSEPHNGSFQCHEISGSPPPVTHEASALNCSSSESGGPREKDFPGSLLPAACEEIVSSCNVSESEDFQDQAIPDSPLPAKLRTASLMCSWSEPGCLISQESWGSPQPAKSEGSASTRSCSESGCVMSQETWGSPQPAKSEGSSLTRSCSEPESLKDSSNSIMLQGFHWESQRVGRWYDVVSSHVDEFSKLGITDVWLPPPSKSVDKEGYLPSQLYNLDASNYGTEIQLVELLAKLHDKGIRGICDIVINHRCADAQDSSGRWNIYNSGSDERGQNLNWKGWAVVQGDQYSDGTGENNPTGESYPAAPNIDHANAKVRESLIEWMQWLKTYIGFDGWRFDFVKGYAPEFVSEYCSRTQPAWAVGELWDSLAYGANGAEHNQDAHRQRLCNWIDGTDANCYAFDFTTKGILQEAVTTGQFWRLKDSRGGPPGLIGWYPSRAVTFIDNHDTGGIQSHWPFPRTSVLIGYAYILTHPGIPCLFWDHLMEWGKDVQLAIEAFIRARKRAGIGVDSNVHVEAAEDGLYFATVGDTLKVKLGNVMDLGVLCPSVDSWKVAACGHGYCVWISKMVAQDPLEATDALNGYLFSAEMLAGMDRDSLVQVESRLFTALQTVQSVRHGI
eukprot:gnl/MRDRNA2_/MRDRNA2_58076_c0_seq1.p1 gnl/MRDRNA2_/MRDRNA2_58076_c0~~gnl/MRDRNA2_/MRDRNA2_58076_c0_seq1.p1  ORF type:complete len:855 (+),score=118.50 gnl/MRDRNA2_/MRDRNA2_58076_c0_seq1:96-2660(+)